MAITAFDSLRARCAELQKAAKIAAFSITIPTSITKLLRRGAAGCGLVRMCGRIFLGG